MQFRAGGAGMGARLSQKNLHGEMVSAESSIADVALDQRSAEEWLELQRIKRNEIRHEKSKIKRSQLNKKLAEKKSLDEFVWPNNPYANWQKRVFRWTNNYKKLPAQIYNAFIQLIYWWL